MAKPTKKRASIRVVNASCDWARSMMAADLAQIAAEVAEYHRAQAKIAETRAAILGAWARNTVRNRSASSSE